MLITYILVKANKLIKVKKSHEISLKSNVKYSNLIEKIYERIGRIILSLDSYNKKIRFLIICFVPIYKRR